MAGSRLTKVSSHRLSPTKLCMQAPWWSRPHCSNRFTSPRKRYNLHCDNLAARKVLPPGYAPAVLWRTAWEELSPIIALEINHIIKGGKILIPESWCKSHLILLPKPGKPLKSPADLRPISLLPPCSELLAFILPQRIQANVVEYLRSIPQFAYVPERGIYQALDRVMSHCAEVRQRMASQGLNIHAKHAGIQKKEITGGIQISMDINKAYDHLPRQHLEAALLEAKVDCNIIQAIMAIHHSATMQISHACRS